MPSLLYPFELYDPIRRRWKRARWVAELDSIAAIGKPFRILGAPEIREDSSWDPTCASRLMSSGGPKRG